MVVKEAPCRLFRFLVTVVFWWKFLAGPERLSTAALEYLRLRDLFDRRDLGLMLIGMPGDREAHGPLSATLLPRRIHSSLPPPTG